MFVPLSHPPGHAQCDVGEALVVIGGVEQKAHCFVIDLPHSDGCFVKAYPSDRRFQNARRRCCWFCCWRTGCPFLSFQRRKKRPQGMSWERLRFGS